MEEIVHPNGPILVRIVTREVAPNGQRGDNKINASGDPQALRERPLGVDPPGDANEAGLRGKVPKLSGFELMRRLGPDRLAHIERNPASGAGNIDTLPDLGTQVHLNPAIASAPAHCMPELAQVEVAVQLAINTRQQIQVECGGYAGRVVIGRQ